MDGNDNWSYDPDSLKHIVCPPDEASCYSSFFYMGCHYKCLNYSSNKALLIIYYFIILDNCNANVMLKLHFPQQPMECTCSF